MLFEDRAYTVRIVGADGASILGTSRIFLYVDVVELSGVITLRLLFNGGVSFVVPAGQTIHSVRIRKKRMLLVMISLRYLLTKQVQQMMYFMYQKY